MPKYLEILTHKFSNFGDMREHLRHDSQTLAKIEKRLRRSRMVSATQYVSERSSEYKHVGQLLCESKEAHDACMAIMNSGGITMASMNQKSSVTQTPKSVRWAPTSNTCGVVGIPKTRPE